MIHERKYSGKSRVCTTIFVRGNILSKMLAIIPNEKPINTKRANISIRANGFDIDTSSSAKNPK
jgi:hypothetical protein